MSDQSGVSQSGAPIPAHILGGQERVRAAGLCGELISDGTQMCIREAGHEPPHGDPEEPTINQADAFTEELVLRLVDAAAVLATVSVDGESRQIWKPSGGPAEYELVGVTKADLRKRPEVLCRYCGAEIIRVRGRWYTLRGRWPNLNHCHYSARNSESVPHGPEVSDA